MLRLPRLLPAVVLACATVLPLASRGFAQSAPAAAPPPAAAPATPTPTAAPPAAAPADVPPPAPAAAAAAPEAAPAAAAEAPLDPQLLHNVESFWHYGKVAKYDLAAGQGEEIIKLNAQPVDVLRAFEDVSGASGLPSALGSLREDDVTAWLLLWQRDPKMKDVSVKLLGILEQGRLARSQNPAWIRQNIEALSVNDRAFVNHLANLRQTGEIAVPYMVDYLRDGSKRQYQAAIRRALVEMGRVALNPLVAATEMKDSETLVEICTVLGSIGYQDAGPYLARLSNGAQTPGAVKQAAIQALSDLGVADSSNPGAMFYALSGRFYYGNAAIAPDLKTSVAYVWFWDDSTGLTKKDVPPQIFNDIMSMRSAEYALKIDPNKGEAISLWLAANFKREADLANSAAAGAAPGVDTTRAAGQPNADFYAYAAGVKYIQAVVERGMRDRNAAVTLAAIQSLAKVAGQGSLFDVEHRPIIEALSYPDRIVRFEAAAALAGALPQKSFAGQDQVVPILAEAMQQTGKSTALILAATQDQLNALQEQLKIDNYVSNGATTPEETLTKASALPGVDVVIICEDVPQLQRDRMEQLLAQSDRLQRTAKVFITATASATPYAGRLLVDPLVNVTTSKDAVGLAPVLQLARRRSGALPLDEKLATEYALKSANLLAKLAISRGQVLDLSVAQSALLGALDDARPEVVKADGAVLALLNNKEIQTGLATKAADDKTADDVKISLFKSLATSARFFGNLLDTQPVDAVTKVVSSTASADVRSAAAEAFGALNLPPDRARSLIIQQSHTSSAGGPLAGQ